MSCRTVAVSVLAVLRTVPEVLLVVFATPIATAALRLGRVAHVKAWLGHESTSTGVAR